MNSEDHLRFNAKLSGGLGMKAKPQWKGRPAAIGRVLQRLVKCRLPGDLLWYPLQNADSRYLAPTRPMAPGTRTPNVRKLPDDCAGLPRDLNTRLAAKTVARPKAVFCLLASPETAAKHQAKEHRSKAFNANSTRGYGMEAKPQCSNRRCACDC